MEPCTVRPYNGNDKFIFLCYSHEDEYRVFPIVEALALKGYRIWYDTGIMPGERWPEVISERLNACCVFLLAQSASSDASHNCRNEINLAVSLDKTILVVRLEENIMSLAMRLQLGDVQWISAVKNQGDSLIKEIGRCKELKPCIGDVDPSVHIIQRNKPEETVSAPIISSIRPDRYDHTTMIKDTQPNVEETPTWVTEIHENESNVITHTDTINLSEDNDKTIIISQDEDSDKTVLIDTESGKSHTKIQLPVIIRLSTHEVFDGSRIQTVIGREPSSCDIAIPSPDRSISRAHAALIVREGKHYVSDLDSANGTFVDGERLERGKSVQVDDACLISLSGEELIVLFSNKAELYRSGWHVGALLHKPDGEVKYIYPENEFLIGREFPWNDNCMNDKAISRKHANISFEDSAFVLHDFSTNGSSIIKVGGETIKIKNENYNVENGDVLVFGSQEFEFRIY